MAPPAGTVESCDGQDTACHSFKRSSTTMGLAPGDSVCTSSLTRPSQPSEPISQPIPKLLMGSPAARSAPKQPVRAFSQLNAKGRGGTSRLLVLSPYGSAGFNRDSNTEEASPRPTGDSETRSPGWRNSGAADPSLNSNNTSFFSRMTRGVLSSPSRSGKLSKAKTGLSVREDAAASPGHLATCPQQELSRPLPGLSTRLEVNFLSEEFEQTSMEPWITLASASAEHNTPTEETVQRVGRAERVEQAPASQRPQSLHQAQVQAPAQGGLLSGGVSGMSGFLGKLRRSSWLEPSMQPSPSSDVDRRELSGKESSGAPKAAEGEAATATTAAAKKRRPARRAATRAVLQSSTSSQLAMTPGAAANAPPNPLLVRTKSTAFVRPSSMPGAAGPGGTSRLAVGSKVRLRDVTWYISCDGTWQPWQEAEPCGSPFAPSAELRKAAAEALAQKAAEFEQRAKLDGTLAQLQAQMERFEKQKVEQNSQEQAAFNRASRWE